MTMYVSAKGIKSAMLESADVVFLLQQEALRQREFERQLEKALDDIGDECENYINYNTNAGCSDVRYAKGFCPRARRRKAAYRKAMSRKKRDHAICGTSVELGRYRTRGTAYHELREYTVYRKGDRVYSRSKARRAAIRELDVEDIMLNAAKLDQYNVEETFDLVFDAQDWI